MEAKDIPVNTAVTPSRLPTQTACICFFAIIFPKKGATAIPTREAIVFVMVKALRAKPNSSVMGVTKRLAQLTTGA